MKIWADCRFEAAQARALLFLTSYQSFLNQFVVTREQVQNVTNTETSVRC